jgi:hypothetical protein
MSNPKKMTASSGNVFADLGFGNPEAELFKAKLVREIRGIIKRRKLPRPRPPPYSVSSSWTSLLLLPVASANSQSIVWFGASTDYRVHVVVRHKPRRASSREIAA